MRNSNIELPRIAGTALRGRCKSRISNPTSTLPHFAYGLHTEQGS